MTQTGIVEFDQLLHDQDQQTEGRLQFLREENQRLRDELVRALATLDRLEPDDQRDGTDLLDSFWNGVDEKFEAEARDMIEVDYKDEHLFLKFSRPVITVHRLPY